MAALERLVSGSPAAAATALLLPPGVIDASLAANARVRAAATLPALQRYAGVVYDGLASVGLTDAEQRVAARSLLIFSGLFGVVRGDEPVPPYRVPAKAVLPDLGVVGTFWRPILDQAMPGLLARGGLVVDLRSSDYTAMWRPGREVARRVVTVRVLSPLPGGGLGVVSFPSKFAKGQLAGSLVRRAAAGAAVATVDDVAAAWLACGGARAEPDGANHLVIYPA